MRPPRKPSSVRMVRTLVCCCFLIAMAVGTVMLVVPALRQQSSKGNSITLAAAKQAASDVKAATTSAASATASVASATAKAASATVSAASAVTNAAVAATAAATAAVKSTASGAAGGLAAATSKRPADVEKVAKALDPEVMQNALPVDQLLPATDPSQKGNQRSAALLEGYKNPCWKPVGAGNTRCLPYVYLAGSFQAGQDSLYEKMVAHPDIVHNEMTRWQFWGEEGKLMSEYVDKHGQSLPQLGQAPDRKVLLDGSASTFAFYWSAALRTHQAFQNVMKPCWAKCSDNARGNKAARETCMEESCHPAARAADLKIATDTGATLDDLHLPLLMAAAYGVHRTSAHLPKLIVILRNPIERVHSAFYHYAHYKSKYGETDEGFLAYVKEQVGALRKCEIKGFSARECALYFEALGVEEEQLFFHADQFIRGMYSLFLEVWLRYFPRNNFLILKAEDYFQDPMATMRQVYTFLELQHPTDEQAAQRIESAGRRGAAADSKARPAMLPEALQILQDLYRPWNQQLVELLGDQSYAAWN